MVYSDQEGTNVTSFIELGKTRKFELEEKEAAQKYAALKRSYVYPLYLETRRVTKYHCGYAVPN